LERRITIVAVALPFVGFIAALGGREIEQPMATEMFDKTMAAASGELTSGDVCHWIGVRK